MNIVIAKRKTNCYLLLVSLPEFISTDSSTLNMFSIASKSPSAICIEFEFVIDMSKPQYYSATRNVLTKTTSSHNLNKVDHNNDDFLMNALELFIHSNNFFHVWLSKLQLTRIFRLPLKS